MKKSTVAVVVGGQYGSEAKGKLVQHLSMQAYLHNEPVTCVRTGGPNAGHTVSWRQALTERSFVTRALSSGFLNPAATLAIAAGGVVDLERLAFEIDELAKFGIPIKKRLFIDPNTVTLQPIDRELESATGMTAYQGSTASGTGSATASRVMRRPGVRLIQHVATDAIRVGTLGELPYNIQPSSQLVNLAIDRGESVIIEGTQGFGLSLYHHDCWPFTTSRDTSAANFCSEVGISPLVVTDVYMVCRVAPIRVGGNSGPMKDELTWAKLEELSGYPKGTLEEKTSVTHRVRRVGGWDWGLFERAIQVNRPTAIAIHGADHIDHANKGKRDWDQLTLGCREWIQKVEQAGGVPVKWIFTGPGGEDMVVR